MNRREDVIVAAGRLFGQRGYHGTSMRDLAGELGVLGSSLYAHVEGKQDLLVEVVERGAGFFSASAEAATSAGGSAPERLHRLISGHIDVIVDHRDEVRTFLNEADALDAAHRTRVIDSRDRYEATFRTVLAEGARNGSMRADLDAKVCAIFILSILNAVERWYQSDGPVSRGGLADRLFSFVMEGIGAPEG